ncbi:MAG: type II toxin-antitoxin system HicB family antitoxin [Stellaceae bacterium]
MLRFYPALIVQDEGDEPGDGYGIVFPDLPGCTSAGETAQEAAENAFDALADHIELTLDAGEPVPEPSAPDAPLPDWLVNVSGRTVAKVLVPVELPGRAVRINITIDAGLLARLDRAASADHDTRSGFIARAVRELLAS